MTKFRQLRIKYYIYKIKRISRLLTYEQIREIGDLEEVI